MAWVDDRIWCHPKFTDLSAAAGWTWTKGCAYSAGFGTKGVLSREQQRLVGATASVRAELVAAGLWEESHGGAVSIHDWGEHNGKRDARREADRIRKKSARASAGTSAGQSSGASAGTARVDGSEGSDSKTNRPVEKSALDEAQNLVRAIAEAHRDAGTAAVVLAYAQELDPDDFASVHRSLLKCRGSIRNEGRWVNEALAKRAREKAAA